jgi:hypothetical protein
MVMTKSQICLVEVAGQLVSHSHFSWGGFRAQDRVEEVVGEQLKL